MEQKLTIDERLEKVILGIEKFDKSMKELRESQAKTDKQLKRTDEKLDRMGVMLGNMGITQGFFAEEFFFRSLENSLKLGNVKFDNIQRNIKMAEDKTDYDILLTNGNSARLIEVKFNAHPLKIKKIRERKIKEFREQLVKYKDYKLYFGIASLTTSPDLEREAKENGIFLLTQKGNHLELLNKNVRVF